MTFILTYFFLTAPAGEYHEFFNWLNISYRKKVMMVIVATETVTAIYPRPKPYHNMLRIWDCRS